LKSPDVNNTITLNEMNNREFWGSHTFQYIL